MRGRPTRDGTQSHVAPLVKHGARSWPVLADMIAQRAAEAVADPDHPWARHWPAAPEMAAEFGTSRKTVYIALEHLGDEGVLVKAWMDRPRGRAEVWVPRNRARELRPPPSREEIAGEIERRGSTGEWAVLPALEELAGYFGVSTPTVRKAIRPLADRGRAVMLRVDGKYRWCVIPPGQRDSVDPSLTMTAPSVVITDLIRRILDGEFRYRLRPDPTVHDRPFLANREIQTQYKVSAVTSGKVRRELMRRRWIVPGERPNTHYRLAEWVPAIERTTPPAPRATRKKPQPPPRNRRARPIAYDLIRRIRTGEFRYSPFPSVERAKAQYRAGTRNVQAAFEVLEQHSWITFQPCDRGRMAVLDPQFRRVPANYVHKCAASTDTGSSQGSRGGR